MLMKVMLAFRTETYYTQPENALTDRAVNSILKLVHRDENPVPVLKASNRDALIKRVEN